MSDQNVFSRGFKGLHYIQCKTFNDPKVRNSVTRKDWEIVRLLKKQCFVFLPQKRSRKYFGSPEFSSFSPSERLVLGSWRSIPNSRKWNRNMQFPMLVGKSFEYLHGGLKKVMLM